jgi:glutaredoxin
MITLYKTTTCPTCKVIKIKLEKKGIPFVEVYDEDVLAEEGIKSVPTLDVDGVRITTPKKINDWINAQEGTNG